MIVLILLIAAAIPAESIPPSPAGGGFLDVSGRGFLYLEDDGTFNKAFQKGFTIEGWVRLNRFPKEGEIWFIFAKLSSYFSLLRGPGKVKSFIDGCEEGIWKHKPCAEIREGQIGFQYGFFTRRAGSRGFSLMKHGEFPAGKWHHFALSFSPKDCGIFLDGKKWFGGSGLIFPLKEEGDPLYFGGYPGYPPLDGQLDEIRISNVQRYDRDFSPLRGPFKADAHTVALYHFDRGRVLEDASGNGHTLRFFSFPLRLRGKLVTTWVVVKRRW